MKKKKLETREFESLQVRSNFHHTRTTENVKVVIEDWCDGNKVIHEMFLPTAAFNKHGFADEKILASRLKHDINVLCSHFTFNTLTV
jgi:hypothetical protein